MLALCVGGFRKSSPESMLFQFVDGNGGCAKSSSSVVYAIRIAAAARKITQRLNPGAVDGRENPVVIEPDLLDAVTVV